MCYIACIVEVVRRSAISPHRNPTEGIHTVSNENLERNLHLSVLRDADGVDCSRNGITTTHNQLRLVGYLVQTGELDRVKEIPEGLALTNSSAAPVLLIIRSSGAGHVAHLTPAHRDEETGQWTRGDVWTMAGGNFGYSTDSRFSRLVSSLLGISFYGALAVHDCIEN